MKLAKISCRGAYRYAFVPEGQNVVLTYDYFETDEIIDGPMYSTVNFVSRKNYLANKQYYFNQLEDTICFDEKFCSQYDWENMEKEEFLKAEDEYILANCLID